MKTSFLMAFLICSANQVTGFYMMGTLVVKGLILILASQMVNMKNWGISHTF